jgi:hypothetical protein
MEARYPAQTSPVEKQAKRAFRTLFFNGVMVHNRAQFIGSTPHEPMAAYTPHPPELPLQLQGHVGRAGIATFGCAAS